MKRGTDCSVSFDHLEPVTKRSVVFSFANYIFIQRKIYNAIDWVVGNKLKTQFFSIF